MTSRTRFISVSRLLAWVWQPRSAGTVATSQPSSSCSISTVNFLGVLTRSLGPQSITGQERGADCGPGGLRREEMAAVSERFARIDSDRPTFGTYFRARRFGLALSVLAVFNR